MLDTVHNQGLLLALGAFRTSPVSSLNLEADEPSLWLRREKLSLQYAIRLAAKPSNPAFDDDDDEFRFNDASTHEGHLRQNGELTWFCNETIIMISHKCIKCKTRTNLKIKAVILC